ncbi:hypothetical protein QVD17_29769 [Tagetes erecta]|uniref:Uncharacterized protein n=1 Tax=Tagetes erecta TaxID=13708 RepID=A0AAD8NMP5_TARER|nr:hypothetical protein QVD17_29769 [Tagetes erecta]
MGIQSDGAMKSPGVSQATPQLSLRKYREKNDFFINAYDEFKYTRPSHDPMATSRSPIMYCNKQFPSTLPCGLLILKKDFEDDDGEK